MDQRMSPAEAVAELRNLASGVDFALTLEELRPLFYRADTLAKQHAESEEIQALLADIKRRIAGRGNAIKQGTAQQPAVGAGAESMTPSGSFPTTPAPPSTQQPFAAQPFPGSQEPAWPPPTSAPPPFPGTPEISVITPVSPDSIPTASFDLGALKIDQPAGGGTLPGGTSPGGTGPGAPFPAAGGPAGQAPLSPAQFSTQNQPARPGATQQPFPPPPPSTIMRPPAGPTTRPPGAPPMPPGAPGARVVTPPRPMAAQKKKSSLLPLFILGGIVWLAAVAGGLFWYFKLRKPPAPGTFAIEFVTNPPGADVRVNHELKGKSSLTLDLPPGEHKLEVVLDGYEPAVSTFTVGEGQPAQVSLNLTPRPQAIRFFTDLTEGKVSLDGQEAGKLQDGQLTLEGVALGAHTVQVIGGKSEVSFSFELAPGKAPTLTSPIAAKNILAVIVSNAGKQAIARASTAPMKVGFNGQAAGVIGPDGLPLDNIFPGDHELTLGEGRDARKIVVNFGPSPVLTAFLKLDLNAGTLVVVTGEDGSVVSLNGQPYRVPTTRGMVRIPNLAVRDYTVSVTKDGFEKAAEQVATVRKGEEVRLEFKLRPLQRMAALRIRGAAQGTTVLLDGNAIGAVGGDGFLSVGNVSPGDHTIELRRDRHQPKRFQKSFSAGTTVEIADDVALEKMPGMLRLQLNPPDSRVVLRQRGVADRVLRDITITIPEGSYTLVANAPGFNERSATIQVAAGETVPVDLRLTRPSAGIQVRPVGMEGFEQAGQWTQEGSWQVHTGGNYVMFSPQPVNGTLTFTSAILKGGRLRWVVNYKDPREHALFEIDSDDFWRKIVTGGRTRELFKAKHGVDKRQGYWTISIDVLPSTITTRIFRGGGWAALDTWTANDTDFTAGKFGFYIPGTDRVGVSNFSFLPRQ